MCCCRMFFEAFLVSVLFLKCRIHYVYSILILFLFCHGLPFFFQYIYIYINNFVLY